MHKHMPLLYINCLILHWIRLHIPLGSTFAPLKSEIGEKVVENVKFNTFLRSFRSR